MRRTTPFALLAFALLAAPVAAHALLRDAPAAPPAAEAAPAVEAAPDAPAAAEDAGAGASKLRVSVRNVGDATHYVITVTDSAGAPVFALPASYGPRSTTNWTIAVAPGKYQVSIQNGVTTASMPVDTRACRTPVAAANFQTDVRGHTSYAVKTMGRTCVGLHEADANAQVLLDP